MYLGATASPVLAQHTAVPKKPARWSIQVTPPKLVNGVPMFLQVTPATLLESMTGTWLGHDLTFDHIGGKNWFVLAGVSLETKPGRYPLKVEAVTAAGKHFHFEENLVVGREKYPTIELKVSKQFTEPNTEQQGEIKQAQDVKKDAFSKITPAREWSGPFSAPVNAPSSDIFGTRRVFNGVTKSVHQGLDYRVGPGTPVMAINSGTVLLARALYFEGNCVVIDHGQGLLSLYLHLSELKVEGRRPDRTWHRNRPEWRHRPRYRPASSPGRALAGSVRKSRSPLETSLARNHPEIGDQKIITAGRSVPWTPVRAPRLPCSTLSNPDCGSTGAGNWDEPRAPWLLP